MTRLIWIALVLAVTVYLGAEPATRAEESIEIDTVINITSQAGTEVITTQAALDAVEKANEVLKKANIKLNVVRVNGPTSAAANAGNADGDSSFDSDERAKAREEGGKELDGAVGAGKGIKLTFGDTPKEGSGTPGISVHHNRCAICKNRPTSQLSGETIAHEVGHILTLCGRYVITSSPTTTTYSDDAGHAADNDNFMAPSNRRTGTNVTTQQAEEMRKKAKTLGRTVTQPATSQPATSQAHGSGGKQDEREDAVPPQQPAPAGLNYNLAYHRMGDPQMELFFTLEDVLDPNVPMTWRYLWLWDIDNNPLTGVNMLGFPGVERGVHIQMNAGGGSLNSIVQFQNFMGGPNFPLAPAQFVAEIEPDDDNPPVPTETSLLVFAPYAEFNFQAPRPKMYLLSINPITNQVVDSIATDFIVNFEDGKPQLAIVPPIAQPGDHVQVFGTRFTPLSSAELYLDDRLILPALPVGPDGTVAGSFPLPVDPQPVTGGYYFVTVVDGTGRAGFNVVHLLNQCHRGDINQDGAVNAADAMLLVDVLTRRNMNPLYECRADVNGDGRLDGEDIQAFVQLLQ